ncbi:2OG-Fe-II oxygenase family oxidoreductase [Lentithecium fluviatile CBS 122367]|uniref:2OG-Fe-II oxygenase family oxidoreductase n=1 Tax=Lentithecium fluviatile CBS 122367 TaxID=1168545 RepID=A0A6G1IC34_9PLEO|nr:2OG-Fe-II oxygenase family oxidoreductase [Lentithecium fluviatile CBS 122367]
MSQSNLQEQSSLKVAHLETIDFAKLLAHEEAEVSKLMTACTTAGFFYVDLQGQSGRGLLEDEDSMYKTMSEFFDQPLDVKMKEDRGSHKHGYKPPGVFAGVETNSRDNYETLKVGWGQLRRIGAKSPLLPSSVKQHPRLFDDFISKAHLVTMTIMHSLSNALHADPANRLEQHHRDDADSNTTLVLLRYPKDISSSCVGHNQHTDIGSLTLLFSKQWGLQILSPETQKWEWVAPRPGQAIINVGDSLRFLSGKKLASCVHRVVPTSETPTEHRYSIAYFLRPENGIQYEDPEGHAISAKQWHDNKYKTFADSHEKQATNSILLGGMDNAAKAGITV